MSCADLRQSFHTLNFFIFHNFWNKPGIHNLHHYGLAADLHGIGHNDWIEDAMV